MSAPWAEKASGRDVEIRIRRAVEEDSAVIAEILLEAFSQYDKDYTPEALAVVTPPAGEILGRFAEGPMWVALKDEEIVGTVSAVPESDHVYIRSMAVKSSAQGLGVGRKLLDAVEEYARAEGYQRMFLYTTHFSQSAIRLYEKAGFTRGRDTAAEEWYGTPGLEMEKQIPRDASRAKLHE